MNLWISSADAAALGEDERPQASLHQVGHELDASARALARWPSSSSIRGGFQSAIVRSAFGAASSPITVKSSPVRSWASSPGFAIVADARRNCGSAP